MTATTLEELLNEVRESVSSPEKKALVAVVTADLVGLLAAHAGGVDVSKEVVHVAAQAQNLAAAEATVISDKVTEFIQAATFRIITGVLAVS